MDTTQRSPFERLGGEAAVRQLVDNFYRNMAESPGAAAVRAMHAPDLAPMRVRLAEYLTAWLGGPRHYFERPDAKCMMSAHAPYAIGETERDQWMSCMRMAMDQTGIDPDLRALLEPAMARVADALRNR